MFDGHRTWTTSQRSSSRWMTRRYSAQAGRTPSFAPIDVPPAGRTGTCRTFGASIGQGARRGRLRVQRGHVHELVEETRQPAELPHGRAPSDDDSVLKEVLGV